MIVTNQIASFGTERWACKRSAITGKNWRQDSPNKQHPTNSLIACVSPYYDARSSVCVKITQGEKHGSNG
jgi:hypothetical protein